jgi:hypothetical protein
MLTADYCFYSVLIRLLGIKRNSAPQVKQAELAENFVNSFQKIERFIKNTPAPFIASLSRPSKAKEDEKEAIKVKPGDIRKIYPKD